jgi:hypothetical protein
VEEQRRAEQALEEAIEQAKEQLERMEQRERQQALEDVRMLAEQILAAHKVEQATIDELLASGNAQSLDRAQRARLRQSSRNEENLAQATLALLVKIEALGASTFPFYLNALEVDHRRLAADVGPPRYAVQERSARLAADLTANWETLIDAIRVEQERERQESEQPPPGEGQQPPEQQDQPLVDFAMELQLLKRLQDGLARDLAWLRQRLEQYARAGIAPDPADDLEASRLLERQLELRRQWEDLLTRLQSRTGQEIGSRDL